MKLVKVGENSFIDIEKITVIKVFRDEVCVWIDGSPISAFRKDAINIINHLNDNDDFDSFSDFLIEKNINLESDNE